MKSDRDAYEQAVTHLDGEGSEQIEINRRIPGVFFGFMLRLVLSAFIALGIGHLIGFVSSLSASKMEGADGYMWAYMTVLSALLILLIQVMIKKPVVYLYTGSVALLGYFHFFIFFE